MTIDELVALYEHPDSVPPLPALAGLDRVDWSALGDAHGPATKAPALIRALASTEPEHRNSAAAALCEHIWHQGTVYSATAAAVPILYELLVADGPHDKATVAVLLATIADGKPPFAHCENDAQEAARWRTILSKAGRSLDAEMADGRRFGAEIRRELARRFDLLYPYLRHPDAGVRVAVAIAVGQFPEIAARLLPDLQAALSEETDEHVRRVLGKVVEGLR